MLIYFTRIVSFLKKQHVWPVRLIGHVPVRSFLLLKFRKLPTFLTIAATICHCKNTIKVSYLIAVSNVYEKNVLQFIKTLLLFSRTTYFFFFLVSFLKIIFYYISICKLILMLNVLWDGYSRTVNNRFFFQLLINVKFIFCLQWTKNVINIIICQYTYFYFDIFHVVSSKSRLFY